MKAKKLKPVPDSLHALISLDFCRDSYGIKAVQNIFDDCHNEKECEVEVRCLKAIVPDISAADLLEAVKTAIPSGYNGFNLSKVEAVVRVLLGDVTNQEEARKILRRYEFSFGRESSPVLYIRCEHRWWMETLKELETAAGADEFSIEAGGTLRIWWD